MTMRGHFQLHKQFTVYKVFIIIIIIIIIIITANTLLFIFSM